MSLSCHAMLCVCGGHYTYVHETQFSIIAYSGESNLVVMIAINQNPGTGVCSQLGTFQIFSQVL